MTGAALLLAYVAHATADLALHPIDFSIFDASVRAWEAGRPMYCLNCESGFGLNYNPPHFHYLILPFALLSPRAAFVAWAVTSAAIAIVTVRVAVTQGPRTWSSDERRVLAAALLTSGGVVATFLVGQVSWLIALFVTLAWRAARHSRQTSTGIWLGLAVGLKPFLLVMVVVLFVRGRWRAAAVAAPVALLSIGVGAALFGWQNLKGWLDLLANPIPSEHLQFFMNGSWTALVARSALPAAVAIVGVILIGSLTIVGVRGDSEDRAWLVGLTAALLISPLGWVYYVPILTGPLVVLALSERLPATLWTLWPVFVFPPLKRIMFMQSSISALLFGSMYTWFFLGLWLAGLRATRASDNVRSD